MNGVKTLKGKILKGVGGFYYVLEMAGRIYECKARGRFRNDGVTPLPGDNVIFSADSEGYGFIEELMPRKNELKRPRVANVDIVAIVASAGKPKIDVMLCDKLIVSALKADIEPIMVINKCDTADESEKENLFLEYGKACDTIFVSAATKEGLDELKKILIGKCSCFAGQSAAGKSSLLNAMFTELNLETGGLSKKTDRGKHTTRHAELLLLEGFSGTAVDTPGFSFLESEEILPEELAYYYKDIEPFTHDCKFSSCLHKGEPDCSVKTALKNGLINKNRYLRYLELLKEIQEKRQRQYD